jgi:hypothetical protein
MYGNAAGRAESVFRPRNSRSGQAFERRFVIERRHNDLAHIVGAFHTSGCFACRLHGRQEQTDQDTDDGNDNQKFNEGEGTSDSNG